jgi:hypothetical protein
MIIHAAQKEKNALDHSLPEVQEANAEAGNKHFRLA